MGNHLGLRIQPEPLKKPVKPQIHRQLTPQPSPQQSQPQSQPEPFQTALKVTVTQVNK